MNGRWWSGGLAIAMLVAPGPVVAQCPMMGGHGGGAHEHAVTQDSKADRKTREAVQRALRTDRGRAVLIETLTADPGFMRSLIAAIAATPEWRAMVMEQMAPPAPDAAAPRPVAPAPPAAPAAVYSCPMHPDVITHTPGSCPRCGMELVRQKAS